MGSSSALDSFFAEYFDLEKKEAKEKRFQANRDKIYLLLNFLNERMTQERMGSLERDQSEGRAIAVRLLM